MTRQGTPAAGREEEAGQEEATGDRPAEVSSLLHKILWTAGTFGASFVLKLGSTVILTRLLAPEIFGVMVIVNGLRIGIELLTDVGIEQNIVNHRDGLSSRFFNTAWTLQIARGVVLSLMFVALAPLFHAAYRVDTRIFLAVSLAPLLTSLASTSIFVLVKNLEVRRRNLFELKAEFINFACSVGLALVMSSVWALVWGMLLSIAARSALSYALPHPPHRLMLDRAHVREIFGFGKWIMLASLLNYASTYIDRLFLGWVASMQTLGLYGIARTIADLPASLASRLAYRVFFPLIARYRRDSDPEVLREFARVRLLIVMTAACGMGLVAVGADAAVALLYDERYRDAGGALALLLFAAWFAVLAQLNEVALLGFGNARPVGSANAIRFLLVATTMPPGFAGYGLSGAIGGLVAGEAGRFLYLGYCQARHGLGFRRQDLASSLVFIALVAGGAAVRAMLGLGEPWNGL